MTDELKIVLLSHGSLATGLINSAKLIIGQVNNYQVLELNHGDNLDVFEKELLSILNDSNQNYILLTDLFGGSPNHVAAKIIHQMNCPSNITCFVGVNLPLLLEVLSMKDMLQYDQLVAHLSHVCKDSIFELSERLDY